MKKYFYPFCHISLCLVTNYHKTIIITKIKNSKTMKTTLKLIIAISILFFSANALIAQQSSKELKKNAKKAKSEAKAYKKAGYYVAPGALPMQSQLENAYKKQEETNDKNEPKYITSNSIAVGETQIAAKLQAVEAAKLGIASQISSQIGSLIKNDFDNNQLNREEAASVTKTVGASNTLIAQELGIVLTLSEMYRNIGKNIEVNITLAYNTDKAFDIAKKVIRKSLEEESKITHEKLDGLMNFDNK
jgi:hypothetical protein